MHTICPSMPIPASTKLTEFLYISCCRKLPHPFLAPPSAGVREHMPPASIHRHCFEIKINIRATRRSMRETIFKIFNIIKVYSEIILIAGQCAKNSFLKHSIFVYLVSPKNYRTPLSLVSNLDVSLIQTAMFYLR